MLDSHYMKMRIGLQVCNPLSCATIIIAPDTEYSYKSPSIKERLINIGYDIFSAVLYILMITCYATSAVLFMNLLYN